MTSRDEDFIILKGKITQTLGNAMFQVTIVAENCNIKKPLIGQISGKIRKNRIKIVLNDLVDIKISKYDLTRCIIIKRLESN